jgi:PPK2 family polyphosphate:nucleotide phosphotransferase
MAHERPTDGWHGFRSLQLAPGKSPHLARLDPGDVSAWSGGKRRAEAALPALRQELDRLQELFYADGRRGLLVVLQGLDTAGKDGVIRHVFEGVNPQGVRVSSFKVPTPIESAHDFLWRIHHRTPEKGEIVIFNRSQYEDVLAARVHDLVPRAVWSRRFRAINAFERELTDEGVTILKFFLHISRDEQRRRLLDRASQPTKQWKLSELDLRERKFWDQYTTAYEEMLERTGTKWAPWYVLPSDHKWFRNLAASSILVDELRRMNLRYPKPTIDLASVRID